MTDVTKEPKKNGGIERGIPGAGFESFEERTSRELRGTPFSKRFGAIGYKEQMAALEPGPEQPGYPDVGRSIMHEGQEHGDGHGMQLPKPRKDDPSVIAKWGSFAAYYKPARDKLLHNPLLAEGVHKWELQMKLKFPHLAFAFTGAVKGTPGEVQSVSGGVRVDVPVTREVSLNANVNVDNKPGKATTTNASAGVTYTPGKKKDPVPNPLYAAGETQAHIDELYRRLDAAMEAGQVAKAEALAAELNQIQSLAPQRHD